MLPSVRLVMGKLQGEIGTDVLKLSNTFSMATGTGANPISPCMQAE